MRLSNPATAFLAALIPLLTSLSCGAPPDQKADTARIDALKQGAVDSPRPDKMLRLVLELEDDHLTVISRTEAPNTTSRRDPDRRSASFFRQVDRDGRVIEERGFKLLTVRRSETVGPDGEMVGHRVEVGDPVFSVAVPLPEGLDVIQFYAGSPGEERGEARFLGEVKP